MKDKALTHETIKVGMAVNYRKAPKAVAFPTEVITKPRQLQNGQWVVNVAMIGEPVFISQLEKMEG